MLNPSQHLVDRLKSLSETDAKQFPGDGLTNYHNRFSVIAEYLTNRVHKEVERSALMSDVEALRDKKLNDKALSKIIYLTDHGPLHIETVIKRASHVVSAIQCALTPYEIYLLLVAIHFHDVGNIHGRKEHEKRIGQVMETMGTQLGDDVAEIRIIKRIAAAHGGYVGEEDKDTIGKLQMYEAVLGQNVRVQLLAAILRFSDELADDKNRAARFLLDDKTKLYGSEIYHMYALHLDSVMVDAENERVAIHFWLNRDDAIKEFQKGENSAYLLDEIFERSLKMHYEAVYCMRFVRSAPPPDSRVTLGDFERITTINTIKVQIEIFEDQLSDAPLFEVSYSMRESGYPQYIPDDIYSLCPEINQSMRGRDSDDQKLNGVTLKRILEK